MPTRLFPTYPFPLSAGRTCRSIWRGLENLFMTWLLGWQMLQRPQFYRLMWANLLWSGATRWVRYGFRSVSAPPHLSLPSGSFSLALIYLPKAEFPDWRFVPLLALSLRFIVNSWTIVSFYYFYYVALDLLSVKYAAEEWQDQVQFSLCMLPPRYFLYFTYWLYINWIWGMR
jgi:hypothetical protein